MSSQVRYSKAQYWQEIPDDAKNLIATYSPDTFREPRRQNALTILVNELTQISHQVSEGPMPPITTVDALKAEAQKVANTINSLNNADTANIFYELFRKEIDLGLIEHRVISVPHAFASEGYFDEAFQSLSLLREGAIREANRQTVHYDIAYSYLEKKKYDLALKHAKLSYAGAEGAIRWMIRNSR